MSMGAQAALVLGSVRLAEAEAAECDAERMENTE